MSRFLWLSLCALKHGLRTGKTIDHTFAGVKFPPGSGEWIAYYAATLLKR